MKFVVISLCVLFFFFFLKDKHRELSFALSVSGVILIVLFVSESLISVINSINELAALVPSMQEYVKLMLRVLGITLLTKAVSDICRDNGENALAGATETAAKITVIALIMPLFENVISIVGGLVK